jgi:hypothetical protein
MFTLARGVVCSRTPSPHVVMTLLMRSFKAEVLFAGRRLSSGGMDSSL